ncbi:MAG: type II toxin-antitoxin system RelE family toxin [Pyrinomonadaceae bacterium]
MKYVVEFKPRAVKDLRAVDADYARRIIAKIDAMRDDLSGDVKRLTNFTPEYPCASATTACCSRLKATE